MPSKKLEMIASLRKKAESGGQNSQGRVDSSGKIPSPTKRERIWMRGRSTRAPPGPPPPVVA